MIYVYGCMKKFFVRLRYMSFAKFIHKDVGHKFSSSTITIWLRKSTLLSGLVKVRCIWQSYYSKSYNQIYGIKVILKMADHSLVVRYHKFKVCKTVKMCKQIQHYSFTRIIIPLHAIQFTMMFMIKNSYLLIMLHSAIKNFWNYQHTSTAEFLLSISLVIINFRTTFW